MRYPVAVKLHCDLPPFWHPKDPLWRENQKALFWYKEPEPKAPFVGFSGSCDWGPVALVLCGSMFAATLKMPRCAPEEGLKGTIGFGA